MPSLSSFWVRGWYVCGEVDGEEVCLDWLGQFGRCRWWGFCGELVLLHFELFLLGFYLEFGEQSFGEGVEEVDRLHGRQFCELADPV